MIKATYFLCIIAFLVFFVDTLAYTLRLVVYKNKQYNLTSSTFNIISFAIKFAVTFQAPLLGVLIYEIMDFLPNIDCGICGSPNCNSLAEDIVRGCAKIHQCVFVQRKMVKNGQMTTKDVSKTMDEIWGNEKLNRKISENEKQNEGI